MSVGYDYANVQLTLKHANRTSACVFDEILHVTDVIREATTDIILIMTAHKLRISSAQSNVQWQLSTVDNLDQDQPGADFTGFIASHYRSSNDC